MNTEQFLLKVYHRDTYNCLHFTRDVWIALFDEDITDKLKGLLGHASTRKLGRATFRAFQRLPAPLAPCLVYMLAAGRDPHLGVYVGGKVLHLRKTGPEYLPFELATRGFNKFRFYK